MGMCLGVQISHGFHEFSRNNLPVKIGEIRDCFFIMA